MIFVSVVASLSSRLRSSVYFTGCTFNYISGVYTHAGTRIPAAGDDDRVRDEVLTMTSRERLTNTTNLHATWESTVNKVTLVPIHMRQGMRNHHAPANFQIPFFLSIYFSFMACALSPTPMSPLFSPYKF